MTQNRGLDWTLLVIQYFTKRNSVKDTFISFDMHVDRTDAN